MLDGSAAQFGEASGDAPIAGAGIGPLGLGDIFQDAMAVIACRFGPF
jgi:hypothetical protein